MSDTTITPEERAKLISHVNSGYMTISGEGLKRALEALEQAEARAEKAEKELAGADAEITELRDELEDSRGTEKDAPNILCAIARLVGVYEHCQELGDDMGTMSLDAVQGLLAEKQTAEANVERLTKMVQILSEWCAQFESGHTLEEIGLALTNGMACPEPWQYSEEAARRAVAAGEEPCQK